MITKLNELISISQQKTKKKIAVAAAEDEPVLIAIREAYKLQIIEPILVGNIEKINKIAENISFDISKFELINETSPQKASKIAVQIIREGKAQILMKGLVGTADYLRAILDKENGLREKALLSHIGFFEIPTYHKLLALTDAAQNIAPTLEEKISILNNAIDFFHRLGITTPKIALIAAVENVNPKMPATLDSAIITQMNRRNQITGCIIDGPLAFDNAISKEAAEHKGIVSEVAGDADLIFAPNIEVGNALYKSFTYFAKATVAAIILGASAPVVLTSRADTEYTKLMSIALASTF